MRERLEDLLELEHRDLVGAVAHGGKYVGGLDGASLLERLLLVVLIFGGHLRLLAELLRLRRRHLGHAGGHLPHRPHHHLLHWEGVPWGHRE